MHWATVARRRRSRSALILGLRFLAPAVPGALVLVVGGLARLALFDLDAHGVALVGDVPQRAADAGAARRSTLVADHVATIVVASVALVLIGFSQTAGDARAFAARHRYRIDIDQESVAQGMANVGRGRLPGHAGVDEPLGELAERVGRRADADGVADHRRARAR